MGEIAGNIIAAILLSKSLVNNDNAAGLWTRFQRLLLQTGTVLHETDPTFDFVAADWNRDNAVDIIAIKKSNTYQIQNILRLFLLHQVSFLCIFPYHKLLCFPRDLK
jgi:hypothetical protein